MVRMDCGVKRNNNNNNNNVLRLAELRTHRPRGVVTHTDQSHERFR